MTTQIETQKFTFQLKGLGNVFKNRTFYFDNELFIGGSRISAPSLEALTVLIVGYCAKILREDFDMDSDLPHIIDLVSPYTDVPFSDVWKSIDLNLILGMISYHIDCQFFVWTTPNSGRIVGKGNNKIHLIEEDSVPISLYIPPGAKEGSGLDYSWIEPTIDIRLMTMLLEFVAVTHKVNDTIWKKMFSIK